MQGLSLIHIFFVVNHLGFPCNSVEHIEKKVWIHLGLKSTDLGIFYKKFLLINILIIGVKLQKHLIKGLGLSLIHIWEKYISEPFVLTLEILFLWTVRA